MLPLDTTCNQTGCQRGWSVSGAGRQRGGGASTGQGVNGAGCQRGGASAGRGVKGADCQRGGVSAGRAVNGAGRQMDEDEMRRTTCLVEDLRHEGRDADGEDDVGVDSDALRRRRHRQRLVGGTVTA